MRARTRRSLVALVTFVLALPWLSGLPASAATAVGGSGARSAPGAPVASGQRAIALTGGYYHTCALTADGAVKCWGKGHDGRLGSGMSIDSLVPVGVVGLSSGVAAIAAGRDHTCALTASGTVRCWGDNTAGQLGNGTTADSAVPVEVAGLPDGVIAIASGLLHTCALARTGGLWCWGHNAIGQLGARGEQGVPVQPVGLSSGVTAVSAGSSHTCAIRSSGQIVCWGDNGRGQLGSTVPGQSGPSVVAGLAEGVAAIAAGGGHTCALMANGWVKCWGYNAWGQLGNGSAKNTGLPEPAYVRGLGSLATAVAAGEGFSCALTDRGRVKCWGHGYYGQLGNGSRANSSTAVEVTGPLSGAKAIAAGARHACAITREGGVKCWGWGWLGSGKESRSLVPVDVVGLDAGPLTAIAVTAGGSHTCALTGEGGVKCWGYNRSGQLGDGSTATRVLPTDVAGLTSGIAAISAGPSHSCALTTRGVVKCWGNNSSGQLGNRSMGTSSRPVDVAGLSSGVIAISAGGSHTCALTAEGRVKCWGANEYGQLGTRSRASSGVPVDVLGISDVVVAISAGSHHTCVLTSRGGVKCWGYNAMGQLGNGQRINAGVAMPVDVVGEASGATAIATGAQHSCAVSGDGRVRCWGYNSHGELGNGSTQMRLVPTEVSTLPYGIESLAAGGLHTCSATSEGARSWGSNRSGQLGDGTHTNRATPVEVAGLDERIVHLSAGGAHTCSLLRPGRLLCWGDNASGQLGDGTRTDRATPVEVDFSVHPTVTLAALPPAGTIALNTSVSFTATVRPSGAAGDPPTVRFAIYTMEDGVWKSAAVRDVVADGSGRAVLRWGFVTAGDRSVRARVLAGGQFVSSAWTDRVIYTVR